MTTQLIINGVETVLPQNFAVTVKRENSFFTKSGEYTYDATIRLDNPVNRSLYGFLHRLNKEEQLETDRSAVLIADGHVYCRGKEIITRWTDDTVSIQIVSGESELNYFIGQDRKISSLNMPSVNTISSLFDPRVVYPTIVDPDSGTAYNYAIWDNNVFYIPTGMRRHQPRLCPMVRMVIEALGYTIGTDQLQDSDFRYAFLVNVSATSEFAKMLPGWTVKDFLTEVEKFCGVVFVTENSDPDHPTCDIIFRHQYYMDVRQYTLKNVVDAYEAEIDDKGSDNEISSKDIVYDLPDNKYSRHQRLPESFLDTVTVVDCDGYGQVESALKAAGPRTVAVNTTDGRKYILRHVSMSRVWYAGTKYEVTKVVEKDVIEEVDFLKNLEREDPDGNEPVTMKIIPAPIDWYLYDRLHTPDDTWNGIMRAIVIPGISGMEQEVEVTEESVSDYDIYDAIGNYSEPSDGSASQLYVALCNGEHPRDNHMIPVAYVDAYLETMAAQSMGEYFGTYTGSLMLQSLDEALYSNGYEIDTRHAYTVETYDPNVIDVRQVYVIRNKRFVCRDVEEVITADGRQKKWKGTFYPIHLSDEALEKRWVLTHGVWDDGAAWLDDGRWHDDYDGAVV